MTRESFEEEEESHRHKCPCGAIWEHSESCSGLEEEHDCPVCGRRQWTKWWGKGPVTHRRVGSGGYESVEQLNVLDVDY